MQLSNSVNFLFLISPLFTFLSSLTCVLFSGVPLTSEDNECRTPEIVAQMYSQSEVIRVLEEERKRLQLIEVGNLFLFMVVVIFQKVVDFFYSPPCE